MNKILFVKYYCLYRTEFPYFIARGVFWEIFKRDLPRAYYGNREKIYFSLKIYYRFQYNSRFFKAQRQNLIWTNSRFKNILLCHCPLFKLQLRNKLFLSERSACAIHHQTIVTSISIVTSLSSPSPCGEWCWTRLNSCRHLV